MSEIIIEIKGSISVGKSVVLDKIEKILKQEFPACSIVSKDLDQERNLTDLDNPDKQILNNLNSSTFFLNEILTK
jgi:hypothetical protein